MAKKNQTIQMKVAKTSSNQTGIRELDIAQLDRKPISDYYRMANRFVNVENHVYYDSAVYDAGVQINSDMVAELFTKGSSQDTLTVNGAVAIPKKSEFLTNMVTDGEFDNSTSFLLEMISCEIFLTGERATTTAPNGAILAPANNNLATYSMSNHYLAISRQFKLQFTRGSQMQPMVDGLLYEFPSPFVASGTAGNLGGFIQNGFSPTWNKLSEIHALQSNDRFQVNVIPLVNGFVPQVPFIVRVQFIGKRIQTLYA